MSLCKQCFISWIITLSIIISTISYYGIHRFFKYSPSIIPAPCIVDKVTTPETFPIPSRYSARSFDLAGKLSGLSKKQINEHEILYQGYVNARNKIAHALQSTERSNPNRTHTSFRALKVAETYAMNGQLLHELYFENLTPLPTSPGKETLKLIEKSFDSFEYFKKDFIDTGKVARGWVVTGYCLEDGSLKNFLLDEHNIYVPIMVIPILILDVYEHAYMIDFGINRNPYLDVFWKQIDWDIVEQRIAQCGNHT